MTSAGFGIRTAGSKIASSGFGLASGEDQVAFGGFGMETAGGEVTAGGFTIASGKYCHAAGRLLIIRAALRSVPGVRAAADSQVNPLKPSTITRRFPWHITTTHRFITMPAFIMTKRARLNLHEKWLES